MLKRLVTITSCILMLTSVVTSPKVYSEVAPTPSSEPTPTPVTYACFNVDRYDYNQEVPYSDPIDGGYWYDTLLVGDSRMGSFDIHIDLEGAEFHWIESLTMAKIGITYENPKADMPMTLQEYLLQTHKNNIYILMGLNELGWQAFDGWIASYRLLIDQMKEAHPSVNIYVMLNYTPTHTLSIDSDKIIERVQAMNDTIIQMCQEEHIYYLNLDEALAGENGLLKDEYASDGIHLNESGAQAVKAYIETHVAKEEIYVKKVCQ